MKINSLNKKIIFEDLLYIKHFPIFFVFRLEGFMVNTTIKLLTTRKGVKNMVEIKEVNMSKKFNLGNYEMIEIGVAGSVSKGESVGDALGNLEKAIEHYFVHQRTQKPPVNMKQQDEKSRIAKAKDDLPSQYQDKLYVHMADGKVCISPLSYLGSELFAEISDFIRKEMGGEYVSAGKDSHWKLP